VLDSLLVGPVPVGLNKFVFEADPPSPDLIPASELVSVTVIILSCSYNDQEFVRVGYYVNNEYDTAELRENPPTKVQLDHVTRNILAEKPRVTKFSIAWDGDQPADAYPPEQPDVDLEEDDEDQYGAGEEEEEEEMDEEQAAGGVEEKDNEEEELGEEEEEEKDENVKNGEDLEAEDENDQSNNNN
jgi:histone chaperone ASF1